MATTHRWEQLLWFGLGQKLRLGEWKPGDALPASLVEMLDYFKAKGVRPVAYVYPILAFLAGTYPNNTLAPRPHPNNAQRRTHCAA